MDTRILVVEDDDAIADSLVRGLTEEGYAVALASDGESAEKALNAGPWDLVILDWGLPGTDGLTLLRRYRRTGSAGSVLFLTARDAVSDRVRGLDGGADDYLVKPFDFDELLARVRALVRRQGRTTALAFRDLRLDLASGRAERAGKLLDLTPKEQAILAFFLRHPEQVLPKTRIYDHVWGESYDGPSNSNALEVHISELRRKLEAHGPRLIHSLRGRGYRLGDHSGDGP